MYGVVVIALFAAYSFISYGIHRIDKRETKEEIENLKSCILTGTSWWMKCRKRHKARR